MTRLPPDGQESHTARESYELDNRRVLLGSRRPGAAVREWEPVRSITIFANSNMENSTGLPMFTGPVTSAELAIS